MSSTIDLIWEKIRNKVDDLIIYERSGTDYQIKFSESEIDTSKTWDSHSIDVFVAKDNKTTSVSLNPDNKRSFTNILNAMLKILNKLSPNPLYKGINSKTFTYNPLDGVLDKKIDNFAEESSEIVNQSIDRCITSGAKRAAGIFFFGKETNSLKSSGGPEASFTHTYWEFNIRGLQDDTDTTGFGQNAGAIPSNAEKDILQAGGEAGNYSKKMKGAKMGAPGTYDVIFSPATGGQVLAALPSMANPLEVLFGTSGLGDRMGEQLAPDFVSVSDEGPLPNAMFASIFDAEGIPTTKTYLFEKGILVNFIHNTSSAALYQGKTTGNSYLADFSGGSKLLVPANHTRTFSGGTNSFSELLEKNNDNPLLYITNSWYLRYTNSLEGVFSVIPRDAMFLIEKNGDYRPVKKLRLSDNLYRIMKNISAMEKDSERKQVKWWDEVSPPVIISNIKVNDCRLTAATK
ncbi:MAG: TldD/PmbA family protein [Candidatus Thorarchaeota archaeon]